MQMNVIICLTYLPFGLISNHLTSFRQFRHTLISSSSIAYSISVAPWKPNKHIRNWSIYFLLTKKSPLKVRWCGPIN